MNNIVVICDKPHDIDPSKCAFCRIESLQAKIDMLMLEYCPDEMTPEQIANWGKNQKPAHDDLPPDEELLTIVSSDQQPTNQDIMTCTKCDECGSKKTYENQAQIPINGKVRSIDWCIHHIVAALNAGGIETIACCCGHEEQDGRIDLADGRILIIPKTKQLT